MIQLTIERQRRGWSQAELARRANVNSTTVSLIENQRFRPGPTQLEKLRRALGVRAAHARRLLDEIAIEGLPVEARTGR